jgi:pimeloyl-ACP methyl ester carboxylesterase
MRRYALSMALAALSLLVALAGFRAATAHALAFTPCPDDLRVGCARIAAPLDHSLPAGPALSLSVRRLMTGASPATDAVVALAGGPGQAALPLTDEFAQAIAPALTARDLLVFDQRGTGQSHPLRCRAISRSGSSAPRDARCAHEIGAQRADFTTAQTVADIEELRQAGGYRRLVLYGTSYGTKVALEYTQTYPQNVAALVLDSVVSVGGPDPLARSTFAALPRVLDDLCAGVCHRITADPVADIARLVARMTRARLSGRVFSGRGRRQGASMGRSDLFNLVVAGDENPALRAELPAAAHAALGGDPAALLRLNLLSQGLVPDAKQVATRPLTRQVPSSPGFDSALYTNTVCEEENFPWTPRTAPAASRLHQAQAAARALPPAAVYPFDRQTALLGGEIPLCLAWPVASSPPPAPGPLPSVPTLVISGAADLRTPTSDAQAVAAQIPGAQVVVVPHTGHSALGQDTSNCSFHAVIDFFAARRVQACPAFANPFPPTPLPPPRLSRVPPTPGVRDRRAARTLAAVQDTLVDLRRELIGADLATQGQLLPGARFGGLRGGYAVLGATGVRLSGLSFIPGVSASGFIPGALLLSSRGASATLTVGGRTAAHGRLHFSSGNRVSGRLGGHRLRVTLARTAVAGSAWSVPRRHLPLLAGVP